VAIGLWNRHSRNPVIEQLLRYTNDVARTLRTGKVPELPRAPLSDLNLSTLAHNALRRNGISWVDQVELLTTWQLTEIKGVGETIANEVVFAVRQYQRRKAQAPAEALQWTEACAAPTATAAPCANLDEHLKSIDSAFQSLVEDQERQAALLLHAADLAAAHGPEHLRTLATVLLEHRA
jgi:hypothetical protein